MSRIDRFLHIDKSDEINIAVFFNACAELKDDKTLLLAKKIFSQLPPRFHQSRLLLQTIFSMFCRCNAISYGLLMKIYNDQDQSEKTFSTVRKNQTREYSSRFVLVITACTNIRFLSVRQSIVQQILHHLLNDRWMQTSVVNMWVSYCQIFSY